MLSFAMVVVFYCSEVVLLTVTLALGISLSTAINGDAGAGTSSLWSFDEVTRAFIASSGFMVVSGFIVSAAILLACFRARPLSLEHLVWLVVLFALHAAFFLFYLRGPAIPSSSVMLIAVGTACVIAAATVQYFFWHRWLRPLDQPK